MRRTADDDDPFERPIVANADQLVIVTALADPPPRMGMIDRILIAAFDAGIGPLLCLTKSDLGDPTELVAASEPTVVPLVVPRRGMPALVGAGRGRSRGYARVGAVPRRPPSAAAERWGNRRRGGPRHRAGPDDRRPH